MGYVEDFLHMELARRRAEKKTTTIDDLATELEKHLSLRNINCQQLQCNNEALEPATPTAKKIAGQKSLSEVQQLLKDSTPIDYRSFQNLQVTTVEVTLTVPAPVTKIVCERLLVKELGRNRTPVTHDELTGELSVDTIDQLWKLDFNLSHILQVREFYSDKRLFMICISLRQYMNLV